MNFQKLRAAEMAADEFLRAVKKLHDKIAESDMSRAMIFMGCKETATVKRKSMDLTNALVKLREPN